MNRTPYPNLLWPHPRRASVETAQRRRRGESLPRRVARSQPQCRRKAGTRVHRRKHRDHVLDVNGREVIREWVRHALSTTAIRIDFINTGQENVQILFTHVSHTYHLLYAVNRFHRYWAGKRPNSVNRFHRFWAGKRSNSVHTCIINFMWWIDFIDSGQENTQILFKHVSLTLANTTI